MGIVIQKYGGSSVADVDKLHHVAEKVANCRREGNDVVVVVSAMGKTTDSLLSLAHSVDEDPPRRELDMLLSTGERISMALLSIAVQKQGLEAISFTGSQSGIITNDRHFDARIIAVRPHRVEDELARGKVVILAGYQGMSYRREITTLGRGGSDTTALAMAAALEADRAEIYSDVDGVYSADPRTVQGAQHLPTLTYEEMQAMAHAGAKVLHADAVEFARKAGIDIHARSTFKPGNETRISGGAPRNVARSWVVRLLEIALPAADWRSNLQKMRELGASPFEPSFEEVSGRFWIDLGQTPDWGDIRQSLSETASVSAPLGRVTIVGSRLHEQPVGCVELQDTWASKGLPVRRLQGSKSAIEATFAEADTDAATQIAHDIYIGSANS